MTEKETKTDSTSQELTDRLITRIRAEIEAAFQDGVIPLKQSLKLQCGQCKESRKFRVDLELVNGFDFSGAKVTRDSHIMCLNCNTIGFYNDFKLVENGEE